MAAALKRSSQEPSGGPRISEISRHTLSWTDPQLVIRRQPCLSVEDKFTTNNATLLLNTTKTQKVNNAQGRSIIIEQRRLESILEHLSTSLKTSCSAGQEK